MIPAHMVHPAAHEALRQFLIKEIYQALTDRAPLERRWKLFEQAYRAMPETEVKEFPFLGAANLVVPVVATDVDTIFARIMGILFAPDSLWSTRPLKPEMVDYAPRVKELLQWAQSAELNAYDAVADWIQEICLLGTGILKQRYKRESRWVYQFREGMDGRAVEAIREMLVKDHPELRHVSLYDFLLPAASKGLQAEHAPWCAEKVELTWDQYGERVRAGIYQHSERITRADAQDKGGLLELSRQRLDGWEPSAGNKLTLWECWTDFDISGQGMRLPLVVTLHLASQTIVRIDFNPFMNQERPYSHARFLRQRGRFLGIGLAEMLMPIQDEVSAMHNQRIDASTIANSPMFAARTDSGLSENEPFWPGRIVITEDPNSIVPLQWGRPPQTDNIANENMIMEYGRRRTGVNDYIAGQTNQHTGYSTATTTIHLLQEAARKIDQTLREIRNALGEAGTRIIELYQQFNQQGKMYGVFGEKDGAMLTQFLTFPPELLRWSVGVEVTATSAALNKEVEIRTNMIVMELVNGFYDRLLQGMMLVINPQMPPQIQMLAMQMIQGGQFLMQRILDSYGVQDVDRLLPDTRAILGGGGGSVNPTGPAFGGAGGISPAFDPTSRMAGFPAGDPGVV